MQLALTYLPVSIIAGAITTIISIVFLFACYLGLFSTVGRDQYHQNHTFFKIYLQQKIKKIYRDFVKKIIYNIN